MTDNSQSSFATLRTLREIFLSVYESFIFLQADTDSVIKNIKMKLNKFLALTAVFATLFSGCGNSISENSNKEMSNAAVMPHTEETYREYKEGLYQANYKRLENLISEGVDELNSLRTIDKGDSLWNRVQAGIEMLVEDIHECQKEMRNTRLEAEKNGIDIPMSSLENISVN